MIVQNSCDAIDDAIEAGILRDGDGRIEIEIDKNNRRITIEDNGLGLSTRYFERTMSKIGNSDKKLENALQDLFSETHQYFAAKG